MRLKRVKLSKPKWISLSVVVGAIGVFGVAYAVSPDILHAWNPVVVKPTEITLEQLPWQIDTTFKVANRSRETKHSIWLKTAIDSDNILPGHITIDSADRDNPLFEHSLGDVVVNYDYVRFNAIDSDGTRCIFFVIGQLPPKTEETFTISIQGGLEITKGMTPRLLLSMEDHVKEPIKMVRQDGKVAYNFTIPEDCTITGVVIYGRRNSN